MKTDKSIAIFFSMLSAMFFAVTFVMNRLMSNSGGHWIWSSSLRYFWMIPFLLILVISRKNLKQLLTEMQQKPWQWMIWSTIGFGLFYAPLTFGAAYGPSWLVASTYQITIVAGVLLSPLINKTSYKKTISAQTIMFSVIILFGILLMQT